jgi:Tfp pilus assembly protein PilF
MGTTGCATVKSDAVRSEKGDREKRIELANTYFFRGRKHLTDGSKDEALGMFRASVAIHEEVYGTYHKRTARSYFFLAQILFKHANEFDRALTAYRRALRVGLSIDGDNNYVEGAKRGVRELLFDKKLFDAKAVEIFFSSITESIRLEKEGLDYADEQDYEYALEAFEKCLGIEEKAEGTFPLDLGHLYIKIADVKRKQGEYQTAINTYRSALLIFESALGNEHADSILCLQGIEYSLDQMNLSDSISEEYVESVFGSIHHCQRGDAFVESNRFREAVNEFEAARLIEEKCLGKYPLTASDIRRKLGLAFRSLKDYDRAILELRIALSINIFERGEDHQSIVATLQDIRSVMEEKGYNFSSVNKYMNTIAFSVKHERYGEHLLLEEKDFSGAIEEFQKSLALEVSAVGKFHLTQGGLFKAIGDAFLQKKVFDFAVVNYRNALSIYQPILGIEHDYTVSLLALIGEAARGIGLSTDQEVEYRKVVSESIGGGKTAKNLSKDGAESDLIARYRRAASKEGSLLGYYHLSTADLHGKIANELKNVGRYDGAIVSYRYILAINLKSLGTDHMNTNLSRGDLVDVCIRKGLEEKFAASYGQNAMISIEHEDNGDEAMMSQNFQSAIIHYKKALEIEEYFLGDAHLVTESLLQKIVECHKLSGKTSPAFHFYRKMIRIYMVYSSPDYDTDYMLHSLETTVEALGLSEGQKVEYLDIVKESVKCEISGDSAEESKNYTQAIDQYTRCLVMEQSLLGMLHPSIWPVQKKIGSAFGKSGDIESAIISHSKALAILESYLGMKEKETIESYNDLLNATLKKISNISDTQQVAPKESFEKGMVEERQYVGSARGEDKKGTNNIYSVFALLRNGNFGEQNAIEGDKIEILKGLAQRWNELDESEAIIFDINPRRRIEGKKSTSDTVQSPSPGKKENLKQTNTTDKKGPEKVSQQQRNKPDDVKIRSPQEKALEVDTKKELGRANDMAKVLRKPSSDIPKLKAAENRALSRSHGMADAKIQEWSFKSPTRRKVHEEKRIGNLIDRFNNPPLANPIEFDEATEQETTPEKQEQRDDALNSLKNNSAKVIKVDNVSANKSWKTFEKKDNKPLKKKDFSADTSDMLASNPANKSTKALEEKDLSADTSDILAYNPEDVYNTPLEKNDFSLSDLPAFDPADIYSSKPVEKNDFSLSDLDIYKKPPEKKDSNADIPEVPAFKTIEKSKPDIEKDSGGALWFEASSSSSSSSSSSFSSYESL